MATEQNYIAEFNCHWSSVKDIKANPKLDFILSYKDSKNYMSLSMNSLAIILLSVLTICRK